jgi:hypothetical protein
MRFVCIIMHQTTVLARVSVDDKPNEGVLRLAERARQTLIRDANRYRSAMLSDSVLSQFADVFRTVTASQVISRQERQVTCFSRGDDVHSAEGRIAMLNQADDLVCLIEAHDDKWIADRERMFDLASDAIIDDAVGGRTGSEAPAPQEPQAVYDALVEARTAA